MTERTRLLNSKELADYIGSTEGTIRTWQCIGKIPSNWCVHIGSSIRYDRVEIDKMIETCKANKKSLKDMLQNFNEKGGVYGCER